MQLKLRIRCSCSSQFHL